MTSAAAQLPERVLQNFARAEARGMLQLVGQDGETVRGIREQIAIEPKLARKLFAFIEHSPNDAPWVLAGISFRNQVLTAFDELTERAQNAAP